MSGVFHAMLRGAVVLWDSEHFHVASSAGLLV